ncbi:MAG: TIGR02391 family protein, partial [Actinobacteria bacterium]|nr:TIGR02391 family protein [Actinomycetota bacterium]
SGDEERVTRFSKVEQSGTKLMAHVFGGTTPHLEVTTTTGQNADDEHEGFALLFMGGSQALKNSRGHGTPIADQPEALEYLALASLLMRRLDIAEDRLSAP